jgi:hypothetical protein
MLLLTRLTEVSPRVGHFYLWSKNMPNRAQRRAAERLAAKQSLQAVSVETAKSMTATPGSTFSFDQPDSASRPISDARLAANQANAQLSRGAVTPEGKQRSSMNALKTGLTSRIVVLPNEDAVIYQQHLARITSDLKPATDRETALVQNIADTEWRLLRIVPLEAALYARGREQFGQTSGESGDLAEADLLLEINLAFEKQFRNLYLQERRLRSHRKEDMAELKTIQQERIAQEQAAAEQRQKDVRRAETILSNAKSKKLTYDWSEFGFDFSESELCAYVAKNTQYVQLAVARLDFDKFLNQYKKAAA